MIRNFKYYLHDNSNRFELADFVGKQLGISADDPVWENVGRPFYEVGLDCTIDTESGEVKILGVSG